MNGASCTNRGQIAEGAWSAGSYHPGGANVVFVDWHVQFVKDTIALKVWRALGTRNGHEVIDAVP